MRPAAIARIVAALTLSLVIAGGVAARLADLPAYVADSGDEWGNTLAPLRLLYAHGNPGSFLHPSLFYDVTAAAYAGVYGALRLGGRIPRTATIADLLVRDERYLVLTARAVSLLAGVAAMAALWALGRRLWNGLSGLAAAALLAVLPLHAIYTQAVRVDSLFLAVFLLALLAMVRALQTATRRDADLAAVLTGLALAANYNGAILIPWLVAALWLRPRPLTAGAVGRALLLVGIAFVAACPFVVLDAPTFLLHFRFIAGLAAAEHPGIEGRGPLFYVAELWQTQPVLTAVMAAAALLAVALGNRGERFVLSLAATYLALFSLLGTKFDRFILPAVALFLLPVAGLPALLARRLAAHRRARAIAAGLAAAAVAACLAIQARRAMPVPRHPMLARSDTLMLEWLAAHAPPHSTILVESGTVPLLDGLAEPGVLGRVLRDALVRVRPALDQEYLHASFVGGVVNYGPSLLAERGVDFAVVSWRNVLYIRRQCEAFPDACAVYTQLEKHARVAWSSPEGTEPAVIYAIRR